MHNLLAKKCKNFNSSRCTQKYKLVCGFLAQR